MRNSEYKNYTLRIGAGNVSFGICEKYTGDPKTFASNIAQGQGFMEITPDTECYLVEYWYHKVGRKWEGTQSIVGTWTFGELTNNEGVRIS